MLVTFLETAVFIILADVTRGGVITEEQNTLSLLTIDMLTMLMKGNAANSRKYH